MITRALLLAGASLILMSVDLPEQGPRPDTKPAEQTEKPEPAPQPEEKPAEPPKTVETPPATDVPVPSEKPEQTTPPAGVPADKPDPKDEQSGTKPADDDKAEASPAPPPMIKEDPKELEACLADLKAIGARFEVKPTITSEENGCGIDKPVELSEVLPGVPLSDTSPMRCDTALSLARWMKETVNPALTIALPGRRITGIGNAASYVCRLRNHAETGKISEHARGNAVDIGAFTLDNGETIAMTPKETDSTMTGAFQRTVTAGACLHFTTVLSPGSDATHQDHLHLDVLERNGGYRYCR